MSRFSRIEVFQAMEQTGLVPVFYHANPETAIEIVKACFEGGARVVEFTNRGDFAQETFAELNKYIRTSLPQMMLGVGSIQDAGTASLYMQLGADFVVTPLLREDVAKVCNRRKVLWISGCGTVSEVGQAEEWGAEIVKVFPGEVLGPSFIKSVKGPCPWARLMPTGGVEPTADNLKAWFQAGVTCVGMGSKLITKEIVATKNWESLIRKTTYALGIIQHERDAK